MLKVVINSLASNSFTSYVLLSLFALASVLLLIGILRFRRDLAVFFGKMFSNDPSVSSTRFISVVGSLLVVVTSCVLVIICAEKQIGLPGGSAELLVGMLAFLVTGNVARAFVANKPNGNTPTTP